MSYIMKKISWILQIIALILGGVWAVSIWVYEYRPSTRPAVEIKGTSSTSWSYTYGACVFIFKASIKNISKRPINIVRVEYKYKYVDIIKYNNDEIQLVNYDTSKMKEVKTDFHSDLLGMFLPNEFTQDGLEFLYPSNDNKILIIKVNLFIDKNDDALPIAWTWSYEESCEKE